MISLIQNNIFPIITAIVAVIALFQTHKQIKLSNKQFLFKNRLEKYTLAITLVNLYNDNKSIVDYSDKKKDEAIIVDFQFENLTNIGYLKDITEIIYDTKNNDIKTRFLLKLEELKGLSNESVFLFKNKNGALLKNFIYNYQNLLLELYKYQIIQNLMKEKNNSNSNMLSKTYIELQKEFGEAIHRERLYEAIKQLNNCYEIIERNMVFEKLAKEIKL